MAGTPINELNDYVKILFEEIKQDNVASQRMEIGIVTFDNKVKVVRKPENVWNNTIIPHLTLGGLNTSMVDGIREAINLVKTTKNYYKSTCQGYYKPWVILITNSFHVTEEDINIITQEINVGVNSKEFMFLAIGAEGANMHILQQISSNIFPPIKLQAFRFKDYIVLYSLGMNTITRSINGTNIDLSKGMNSWKDFEVN